MFKKEARTFMRKVLSKVYFYSFKILGRIKRMLNINIEYYCFGIAGIQLPGDHLLPVHQRIHTNYDRFLPHLSPYLGQSVTVIDVGANCGDTLAGMFNKNPELTYLCIEPDDYFYSYLKTNIGRLQKKSSNASIVMVKSLIGKSITDVILEGDYGTRRAVVGAGKGGLSSRRLDDVIKDNPVPPVRLLKSDVDGFDYDVIDSAETLLREQKPILFFECQLDHDFQHTGYEKTVSWLASLEYYDWTIFDNFGEIVLRTDRSSDVIQLMEYVWRQNTGNATRTIYGYDLMVATKADSALIDKVLTDYRNSSPD